MQLKIFAGAAIAVLIAAAIAFSASQRPESRTGTTDQSSGSPASPAAAPIEKLPAARGKVVLRIAGGKAGSAKTVDFATLDRIARERVKIRDPFLKRDVTFTAVRMSDLLSAAGVPASATSLHGHALDDYHVDLPIAALRSNGLLATRMNGKPIAIADGGPIRLVFTGKSRVGDNTDNWIWSLDSIRAR
jgi:hypothetical protein